jgi:dihydroxyacetone kinase
MAAQGSESTRNMLPKHGRAAYYGEKSIGVLDGGSVVGKLIFEALAAYFDPISTT